VCHERKAARPDDDQPYRGALRPGSELLAKDTAFGAAAALNWLVNEKWIAPQFRRPEVFSAIWRQYQQELASGAASQVYG
jgi:hypothetical protein